MLASIRHALKRSEKISKTHGLETSHGLGQQFEREPSRIQ
jgi:hypothetical protein